MLNVQFITKLLQYSNLQRLLKKLG